MFELVMVLLKNVGIIAILALLFSQVPFFRASLRAGKLGIKQTLFFSFFFGCIGIYGTYSGVAISDAVANSRVIGPFVGGLLGGPVVGFFSGFIAGGHRYLINPSGFTSFACVVITPLQGLMIGFLSQYFYKTRQKWLLTLTLGALAEVFHMFAVLLFSRPWGAAVDLVQVIGPPMIIANAIGISIFVIILENILRDRERSEALRAKTALTIINDSLPYLKNGLNCETATITAQLMMDKLPDLAAVSFTSNTIILAHVGKGQEHHCAGGELQNLATKEVLKDGHSRILKRAQEIGCREPHCVLKSAVIVPLIVDDKIIGSLKLYKDKEYSIGSYDVELALGLASFFSTQISLQQIQENKNLLREAEFKSLQAQINPHFLFNAINTISSIVRVNAERARELLLGLGVYYRGNMIQDQSYDIQNELDHVRAYLLIEQARFEDFLEVEWEVEEGLKCSLPPLSIQPLVENAIKHGLRVRKGKGKVWIVINRSEKGILFCVRDNGVGINEAKIKCLLDDTIVTSSFALKNIHRRLILKFGTQSGLNIKSTPAGTEVSFLIPDKL